MFAWPCASGYGWVASEDREVIKAHMELYKGRGIRRAFVSSKVLPREPEGERHALIAVIDKFTGILQ
jgi:hypothetical protein